jgi:hypothetical protein
MSVRNLIGQKFNKLLVFEFDEKRIMFISINNFYYL